MPFLGDYKIYDTAEPCNYTGQKLIDTMEKVVSDGLSADGRELNLMGCCVGPNGINLIVEDKRLVENLLGATLQSSLQTSELDWVVSSLKEGGLNDFRDLFCGQKEESDIDRVVEKFNLKELKQAMQ